MKSLDDIPLMHPRDADRPFSREGWIFEFKYDGFRILAGKESGLVRLLTRNGNEVAEWFPNVVAALGELRGDFIVDAEACVLDDRGVPDFESMRHRARKPGRGAAPVVLFVFDLLFAGGRDLRGLPLLQRKRRLEKLLPVDRPSLRRVTHVDVAGEATYAFAIEHGFEGVVAKRADSPYEGCRTWDWLKIKPEGTHDGWKRPLRKRPAA